MAIPGSPKAAAPPYAWYRDLNRYQWFVVAVASVGWMFDTMAQQLFNLARVPALRDLMGASAAPGAVAQRAWAASCSESWATAWAAPRR
jgi:hypothetical protein